MCAAASAQPGASRCLTEQEIAALQEVTPGAAPHELAIHLAGCGICQERALFGGQRRRGRSARMPPAVPTLQRALLLLLLVLGAMGGFLYTLQKLVGRIQ